MCRSAGHLPLNLLLFTSASDLLVVVSPYLHICFAVLLDLLFCMYPCAELEEVSNTSVAIGSCALFLSNMLCMFTVLVCVLIADISHLKLMSNNELTSLQ